MKPQNFLFEGDEESPDSLYSKSEDEKNVQIENDVAPIANTNNIKKKINKTVDQNTITYNKSISDENAELEQNFNKIPSDITQQINELKSMIDARNQQFDAEFDELKRKHQAKLKNIKQNHMTREQAKSNAFDLEYRNIIWTTSLKHLNRGCFTEDLRLLFQQAISDEQYKLEKELIKLKQKNDEEIQNLKENLPKMNLKKKVNRNYINMDIMDPIEMARIIYNNCFSDPDVDDFSDYEVQMIDKLIRKIQRDTMILSNIHISTPHKPLRQKSENVMHEKQEKKQEKRQIRKSSKSPKHQQKDKYISYIESHQEACQSLEKTVKKTDEFIRNLQGNDWFNDMFPHVD